MDALEVIAVILWAFVVSLVGGLVGLVLGNHRLPVVVLFATSPAAGAGATSASAVRPRSPVHRVTPVRDE